MSLINCPECKKQINSEVDFCPHCGKKQDKSLVEKKPIKKSTIILMSFIGIIVLICFIILKQPPSLTPEQKKQQEKIEAENKRLSSLFGEAPRVSSWDGSVYIVKQTIEASAKDPDSLVFENWSGLGYNNQGWTVKVIYRGKNSFGGYVRECKWFVIKFGNIISVFNCN